ncbi:MAG: T9SS type A sorting domain-containing protein [Crocinitomicaceae bacterium]|nr:T9SS type A sorting domain-containing protein [Crocinitomicaceae bacterium]
MKKVLLIALAGVISSFSFGQVSITVNGAAHSSGTSYTFASDTNKIDVNGLVENTTASPITVSVERVILSPVSSWVDDMCWATSSDGGLTGQCYNGIQASNPYLSPDSFVINPGDNGVFKGTIKPKDPDYGCSDYRYYFIQDGSIMLDSIDVTVCKTASAEELAPALSISVAPNPANSYFKVKTNDVTGATVQVVDVLGNVVLKETVMGSSKTINTESFRNGVYFVRVSADNQRPINRKVIVRH